MAEPAPVPLAPASPTTADPQHTMNRTADSGVELTSPELSPQPLQSQISSPDVLSPSEAGLELEGEERLITAENVPEVRTDVVRESDQAGEELPGEGMMIWCSMNSDTLSTTFVTNHNSDCYVRRSQ